MPEQPHCVPAPEPADTVAGHRDHQSMLDASGQPTPHGRISIGLLVSFHQLVAQNQQLIRRFDNQARSPTLYLGDRNPDALVFELVK